MNHALRLSCALALYLAMASCIAGPSASARGKSLSVPCGDAQVTIQCKPKSAQCKQTTLRLSRPGNKTIDLAKPRGMARYTAVGLACVQASDTTPYVEVQYGERPYGCAFCEWYHLYTTQGELLTHSKPPILTDDTLPGGKAQRPNNDAFEALSRKLGLTRPKLEFFN